MSNLGMQKPHKDFGSTIALMNVNLKLAGVGS